MITFPFTGSQVRALKVGDEVLISGVVFTGRDERRMRELKRQPACATKEP